jgi:alkylation response protein AidB-like acyl-CoA dehydrogenase
MNVDYTAEELAFQGEVRAFIKAHLPPDIRSKVLNGQRLVREDFMRWQHILHQHGWGSPYWPQAFGGTGWSHTQIHLFEQACIEAGAPRLLDFGQRMLAPVLMKFGTPEQQARFLPRILNGDDFWCQGYSEPGSGSDLASLKMRAERVGDHYIVNGQKTWTTLGQFADWIFCLVRTSNDGRPQHGISFLLIDMKSPGIKVQPIVMLDGEHEINDVFFDNVEVPAANLVGGENKGWTCAKYLLVHERFGQHYVGYTKVLMRQLMRIARHQHSAGRPLLEDPRFRDRIAQCEMEVMAHEMTLLRTLDAVARTGSAGAESSILKIRGTELMQQIFELIVHALGPDALAHLPGSLNPAWQGVPVGLPDTLTAAGDYFNMRKLSIFGGSNEIQRNIIAQRILGL